MQTDDMVAREKVLVTRAQAGDERALAELFLASDNAVRSVLRKLGLNSADFDDVLQVTRIQGWSALKGFRGECKFSTWMCTIAKNTAKNVYAAAARRPHGHYATGFDMEEWLLEALAGPTGTPEETLIGRQTDDRVFKELERLPAPMREALKLRLFDGLSYEEIGERQRCAIGTVRSRLHRGMRTLEERLGVKLLKYSDLRRQLEPSAQME
jgi:RNA polymerase sigma-70 factor (ECF subfamily)